MFRESPREGRPFREAKRVRFPSRPPMYPHALFPSSGRRPVVILHAALITRADKKIIDIRRLGDI